MGAGTGHDGAGAVQTHMTDARLADPEVLEWRFPVLLKDLRLCRGSGPVSPVSNRRSGR